MAFASFCGPCFGSCCCVLLSSICSNRTHEEQRWKFVVFSPSTKTPPCRLHSVHPSLSPVGDLSGGRSAEDLSGFRRLGWVKSLGFVTSKTEEHFGNCRCEFGSGTPDKTRGGRGGSPVNVASRSGVSLVGSHVSGSRIFENDGELQQHQERDASLVGVCRERAAAPAAASSSGSVATAEVDVEVPEDSREVLLDTEIEPRISAPGNGDQKDKPRNSSQSSSSKSGMRWSMLLSTAALEDAHLSRASSVTDAHVLRRKGRLKEQDGLIEFIISMHSTHSPFQVMEKLERWIREHLEDPKRSTLARLVPSVGRFYTPLPLVRALQEYDEFASLSRRRYVPPNFAEIRHVLNIAQVHAIAGQLSLITFDADGTLYADGHHIERDNKMIDHIIKLMQEGCHVAIVTAAGYPGDASRYEGRLAGLLAAFKDLELPPRITQLFHVMGGECNYLLRVTSDYRLDFVPDNLWKTRDMQEWSESDVKKLLDEAEASLISAAARLRLPVELIRKPRAVGAIPKEPTIYEVLEEMALTVQMQLIDSKLPYCAFNGGNDVFVDVDYAVVDRF